jgi:hypothetical protein
MMGLLLLYGGYIALLQFVFARTVSRHQGHKWFFILSLVLTLVIIFIPGVAEIQLPAIPGMAKDSGFAVLLFLAPVLSVLFWKMVLRSRKRSARI